MLRNFIQERNLDDPFMEFVEGINNPSKLIN